MARSGISRNDDPFEPSNQIAGAPLESIVCTQELRNRPSRPPEYETENRALAALAIALADSPRTILQTLADRVFEVLHADSAGLSLLTKDESRFYWAAVAGAWGPHIGADAPRSFGPCGDVLNHNAPMLFAHWERRYPYLSWAMPLADEGLLVPFYANGKAVGTIWAVAHDNRRRFDAEDLRMLESISRFASAAYQAVQAIENLKVEIAAREKAETEVRELANALDTQVRDRTQELERQTRDLLDSNNALESEIAARERTQQELQRSEAFLVEGQHLSRTGTFSWRVATDEIIWSEQLYRIFQFDHSLPVTIERVRTRVYPEDLPLLQDMIERARSAASEFEYEHRLLMPDQSVKYVHLTAHPSRDVHGQLEYVGAAQDVTESKIVEEALRQSEERVRLIVDSIDGLVMTATPKGEIESVNKQVLEYFGRNLEELKDWRTNDAIHPDDLPGALALWTHSVETGEPYHFDQRLRRADGAYRWFRVGGRSLCDAQGNVVRWYVLLMDIDERKRAEAEIKEAYLHLAEAQTLSKTGSFFSDLLVDHHIWSEEARRIFEFDPAAKITVEKFRNKIHPEDLPFVETVLARGMKGMDVDFSFRIVTSRGGVKHIRGYTRVVDQIAGRPLFRGALQDVTAMKIAEEALNKARSELAHVARVTTLNALTASIAHEVNQPLSGIVTNASTCLRMLDSDPPNLVGARETARRTIRDGKRASEVITRLRALFSKKESRLEPLDLNEATQEVIALSLSDLQRNRVILKSELADELPPVTGDRIQLQQVILNLLRNASDAMTTVEDRPRQLLIRTERDEEDRVRLTVKDVGTGLILEATEKLFEAFYTTKPDGMGIGLSVSRSIIEAHRGQLWAAPNDGPGATFSFSIPCGIDTKVQ